MASERSVVRRLHDLPRPTARPPSGRRRYLVATNDNRPPLPVRLRRPLVLAVILLAAAAIALRWLA